MLLILYRLGESCKNVENGIISRLTHPSFHRIISHSSAFMQIPNNPKDDNVSIEKTGTRPDYAEQILFGN